MAFAAFKQKRKSRKSGAESSKHPSLKTFLWASLLWCALGCSLTTIREGSAGTKVFLVTSTLCLFDLFALGKTVAFLSSLVSSRGTVQRAGNTRGAILWGSLKLSALFALVGVLFRGREMPPLGLVLGYLTLIFVPVAGGLVWGFQNRNPD
jgi:hypothetical protein